MLLIVAALILGGCAHKTHLRSYVGKSVGFALEQEQVRLSDCRLSDDPPCVLQRVTFRCRHSNRLIALHLVRSSSLFSESRDWPSTIVQRAQIASIDEVDE